MTNPRRALLGGHLDVADFPGLDLADVRWATGDDGALTIELVETRPLTDTEQQDASAIAEAMDDTERALRDQARTALDTNRNFRDNIVAQLLGPADGSGGGANGIILDASITQAEAIAYVRQLAQAVKALTNQADALTRQMIGMARIVLEDRDGTD